jgi:hypothetical protein
MPRELLRSSGASDEGWRCLADDDRHGGRSRAGDGLVPTAASRAPALHRVDDQSRLPVTIDRDEKIADNANRRTHDVEGTCTADDLRWLRALQNDRCAYCARALDGGGELDHVLAVVRGGSSHPSNLRWACHRCNWLKGDLELADFERDKGGTTGRDEEGTGRQKRKRRGTAGEIIAARLRRDRAFYWWLDQPEIKPRVAQPMSSLVRLARRVLD